MSYQYLLHDGFVYRQPTPSHAGIDPETFYKLEIWDGTQWRRPTVEIAMQPLWHGTEITEDAANHLIHGA